MSLEPVTKYQQDFQFFQEKIVVLNGMNTILGAWKYVNPYKAQFFEEKSHFILLGKKSSKFFTLVFFWNSLKSNMI